MMPITPIMARRPLFSSFVRMLMKSSSSSGHKLDCGVEMK